MNKSKIESILLKARKVERKYLAEHNLTPFHFLILSFLMSWVKNTVEIKDYLDLHATSNAVATCKVLANRWLLSIESTAWVNWWSIVNITKQGKELINNL